ncbi:class D atypical G-protein coupled receptor GPRbos1, putative [Pediculus humanus corporis]|uniref:Class D atypical G-protein coupled receptor GPRbos1, putative n=1 Tax=Pediculus humanus subsp. corporis TaxID=121224 RepID=E0VBQ4_PEDHC|nr:class D atypical G-protein coupled receptor GPRbos1, putative [Pediculus humanus corporis]EEB10810.1 class D atypical G-protein coupled receptor GPRbos1, putative [Pediculus humanus corporis]
MSDLIKILNDNKKNGDFLNEKLILVPTDLDFDRRRVLDAYDKNVIVLLPSYGDEKILKNFLSVGVGGGGVGGGNNNNNNGRNDYYQHSEPTKSPIFIGTALKIIEIIDNFKNLNERVCNYNSDTCYETLKKISLTRTNDDDDVTNMTTKGNDVDEMLKILKLKPNPNNEMFLYIASYVHVNEDAAIFQIYNFKIKKFIPHLLKINDNLFVEPETLNASDVIIYQNDNNNNGERIEIYEKQNVTYKSLNNLTYEKKILNLITPNDNDNDDDKRRGKFTIPEVKKKNCIRKKNKNENDNSSEIIISENVYKITMINLKWKKITWVIGNTCLGISGLLLTSSILTFVTIRMWKEDLREGGSSSASFMIFLMLSVMLTFISSFPYHIESEVKNNDVTRLISIVRIVVPTVSYAILFSSTLSRCLMLATSETRGNGFVSHVNGIYDLELYHKSERDSKRTGRKPLRIHNS